MSVGRRTNLRNNFMRTRRVEVFLKEKWIPLFGDLDLGDVLRKIAASKCQSPYLGTASEASGCDRQGFVGAMAID